MQAKKLFIIIAYDISITKRRNKIVKLLENYGERINLSVFECMLTESRFSELRENIEILVNTKTDQVVYYTICVDCYTKIIKYPEKNNKTEIVVTT